MSGAMNPFTMAKRPSQTIPLLMLVLAMSASILQSSAQELPQRFAVHRNPHFQIVRGSFTWEAATTDAIARGGHLATFADHSEWTNCLSQVQNELGTSRFWIGASDATEEGSWEWVTGEPWRFSNWAVGEPSNNQQNEHYAHVHGASRNWNDLPADDILGGYILEFNRLGTGLIAHYSFEGEAIDLTANTNHLQVLGASLTADRFNRPNAAYYFDGLDDRMHASDRSLPIGNSPRSVSFWMRSDAYRNRAQ